MSLKDSVLSFVAAVLGTVALSGCAALFPEYHTFQDAKARYAELGCEDYPLFTRFESYRTMFPPAERYPVACRNLDDYFTDRALAARRAYAGMERVSIYDASTGRTTSAIVPKGTVVIASDNQ